MTQKITSAYANKLLKSLEDEKAFWVNKESESSTYEAALGETPTVPEYDYEAVAATINQIDERIVTIKHALNLANATAEISVGDKIMSVDSILVRMAQLNRRKNVLDVMRKRLPQSRIGNNSFARNATPEFQYINYDLETVKKDFERVSDEIMQMQLALDQHNQTATFEVEL